MKKRFVTLLLSFTLVFSMFSVLPVNGLAASSIKSDSWMQYLPDDAPITEVNLPGTHDAACRYFVKKNTLDEIFTKHAKTQVLSLPEQLEAGVRFWDCRICLREQDDNYLTVPHNMTITTEEKDNGIVMKIDTMVSYAENFVKSHPTEFVVLMIQEDGRTYDNESEKFKELKEKLISSFKNSKDRIYLDFEKQGNPAPTVEDARGKIIAIKCGDLAGVGGNSDRLADYKWEHTLKPYFDSVGKQDYTTPAYMYNNLGRNSRPLSLNVPARGEIDDEGARVDGFGLPTPCEQAEVLNKYLLNYNFKQGYFYGWVQFDGITESVSRKIYLTNNFAVDVDFGPDYDKLAKQVKATRVSNLKLSAKKGKMIKLSWKKLSTKYPSKYVIYRSLKKTKSFKKITTVTNSKTTYTNKKLKKGKRYYYKVAGYVKLNGKWIQAKTSYVKSAKAKK